MKETLIFEGYVEIAADEEDSVLYMVEPTLKATSILYEGSIEDLIDEYLYFRSLGDSNEDLSEEEFYEGNAARDIRSLFETLKVGDAENASYWKRVVEVEALDEGLFNHEILDSVGPAVSLDECDDDEE
jgi:hypothetical protein